MNRTMIERHHKSSLAAAWQMVNGWNGNCRTPGVSDRHLTDEVRIHCGDHEIKAAWQARWLVAVHLDPIGVRPSGKHSQQDQ